jgi:putative membrane protein
MAYNIHLKQTLVLYLVSLPFQLVNTCNWATIPIVAIGSFILYGVENIGHEIENPFGYDENDLKLDEFVDKLKMEFLQIRGMAPTLDCKNWTVPAEL